MFLFSLILFLIVVRPISYPSSTINWWICDIDNFCLWWLPSLSLFFSSSAKIRSSNASISSLYLKAFLLRVSYFGSSTIDSIIARWLIVWLSSIREDISCSYFSIYLVTVFLDIPRSLDISLMLMPLRWKLMISYLFICFITFLITSFTIHSKGKKKMWLTFRLIFQSKMAHI